MCFLRPELKHFCKCADRLWLPTPNNILCFYSQSDFICFYNLQAVWPSASRASMLRTLRRTGGCTASSSSLLTTASTPVLVALSSSTRPCTRRPTMASLFLNTSKKEAWWWVSRSTKVLSPWQEPMARQPPRVSTEKTSSVLHNYLLISLANVLCMFVLPNRSRWAL